MKILVIRFSSIGDIVWTAPVVRLLKKQLPDAEVHFITKKSYQQLLEQNPHIDKLHLLDKRLEALVAPLRAEKFDLVIDLHANLRSAWLKWKLGVKSLTYQKYRWEKWLLVKFKINRIPQKHIIEWYLDTLKPLGLQNDGKGLEFFIAPDSQVQIANFPASYHAGYVAFVIGASEYTKKLPLNKLIELIARVGKPILLVGGKEDFEQGENIIRALPDMPILNVCGSYDLAQSASIVGQASFVIGHDTGLTHIAAALKKKVYGIYGGTLSQYLYPYTDDYTLIENTALACRPCSKAGKSTCPKGHFKCMQDLDFSHLNF